MMSSCKIVIVEEEPVIHRILPMAMDHTSGKKTDSISQWTQEKLTLYFGVRCLAINGSSVSLDVITSTLHPENAKFIKKDSNNISISGCCYDCFKLFNEAEKKYLVLDSSDKNKPKLIAVPQSDCSNSDINRGYNFNMSMYSTGRTNNDDCGNIALYFATENYYYYLNPDQNGTALDVVKIEKKPCDCDMEPMSVKYLSFKSEYKNN